MVVFLIKFLFSLIIAGGVVSICFDIAGSIFGKEKLEDIGNAILKVDAALLIFIILIGLTIYLISILWQAV